jgi:hypothetical protein
MASHLDLVDSFHAVAEGLRSNRAERALIKVQVACTLLDCANTARDAESRRRTLKKAFAIVASLDDLLDEVLLTSSELNAIKIHFAELRSRIIRLDPKGHLGAADAPVVENSVAASLARGDMVYFFLPDRQPLFAGDLFRIALRLRFLGRIQSR